MHIIVARHGQSEGNRKEEFYASKGDPHIELTREGWQQVIGSGQYLDSYLRAHKIAPPQKIWVSPFMRTRQTLRGMIEGFRRAGSYINPFKTPIQEDPRLVEQTYGAMPYMKYSKGMLNRAVSKLIIAFSKASYDHSPYMSVTPMGESPSDLVKRLDSFVSRLHQEQTEHGTDNVLIVAHGAVIKGLMMHLCDLPMDAWKNLDTPHNGDLFIFDDETEDGSWRVTRIYDGEKHEALNENPVEGLTSKLTVNDLPALPPRYQ